MFIVSWALVLSTSIAAFLIVISDSSVDPTAKGFQTLSFSCSLSVSPPPPLSALRDSKQHHQKTHTQVKKGKRRQNNTSSVGDTGRLVRSRRACMVLLGLAVRLKGVESMMRKERTSAACH